MSSEFFGPTQRLLCKDGSSVLARHVLEEADYVLVYFAGSWCEPCGEFAPLLASFYETHHAEKSFEVVLLSFDQSEQAMMDDFARHHGNYYCLPYADACATRQGWMETYNVKGLPSLVVFHNASPRVVVTHYGVNWVVSDPDGTSFPWPETATLPNTTTDEVTDATAAAEVEEAVVVTVPASGVVDVRRRSFFDDPAQTLLRQDGSTVAATTALCDADYVLVYCSAEWCPYCVKFTPALKRFYDAHHVGKKFEIVFMSFDTSESEMMEYFRKAHGDYYCLPFDDVRSMKSKWIELYSLKYIPTVFVFEKGYPRVLVTVHGEEMVVKDADAQSFPWPDGQEVRRVWEEKLIPWKTTHNRARTAYGAILLLLGFFFLFVRFVSFFYSVLIIPAEKRS